MIDSGARSDGLDEQRRYRLLAENASDVVMLLGPDGRVQWVSPSIAGFGSWSEEALLGQGPWPHIHPDDLERTLAAFSAATSSTKRIAPFEILTLGPGGEEVYVSITSKGIFEHGRLVGVVVAIRDIDERVRAREALSTALDATRSLWDVRSADDARRAAEALVVALGGRVLPVAAAGADAIPADVSFGAGDPAIPAAPLGSTARALLERHLPGFLQDARRALDVNTRAERLAEDASLDALTGVPNRRMLGRALGRAGPGDTLIMVDLDHFKELNDTLGHLAGDDVLYEFGRTLRDVARARDVVGRYGGEEFLVLVDAPEAAEAFLRRLRDEWVTRRPHPVTFSAGVAVWAETGLDSVAQADAALYRAKEAGRDRWVVG